MKKSSLTLKVVIFSFTFSALVFAAWAQNDQEKQVIILDDKIITEMVYPPDVRPTETRKPIASKQSENKWLEVEVGFEVNLPEKENFLDEVTFKIYIEGTQEEGEEDKESGSVLLVGETTYVNVPASRENFLVFYLHPNTVQRYIGKESNLNKFNIYLEAVVQGSVVDAIHKKKEDDPDWYASIKKVPNVVFTKSQSPWMLSYSERYPQEKINKK